MLDTNDVLASLTSRAGRGCTFGDHREPHPRIGRLLSSLGRHRLRAGQRRRDGPGGLGRGAAGCTAHVSMVQVGGMPICPIRDSPRVC